MMKKRNEPGQFPQSPIFPKPKRKYQKDSKGEITAKDNKKMIGATYLWPKDREKAEPNPKR